MKIVFSGGGTMGSVSPLLAMAEHLLSQENMIPSDFVWIGTKSGPEGAVVRRQDIEFHAICSGKLRRYFSWKNFTDPFHIIVGFVQAHKILRRFKPDVVISAGSFVAVPVVYAAKTLGIKVLVHQLDIQVGLANSLAARVADTVTVSWADLLEKFPGHKPIWTGTPVRKYIIEPVSHSLNDDLHMDKSRSQLLFMGGGTGAAGLNRLVIDALPKLLKKYGVTHLTGANRSIKPQLSESEKRWYVQYDFAYEDFGHILQRSDLVICRAGLGTISELMAIGKPSILIPMPETHQEANAEFFARQGAAEQLDQIGLTADQLVAKIDELMEDDELRIDIAERAAALARRDANAAIVHEIIKLCQND
ncbi:MAG: undecaprenyldiphospho-muramoylpentapeptide beta-N-acetylglucosaminyltransferase [Candidatus Komeilibacteria bacterium]|nr:undecaprenyldiphospho-muramoylpentapeptide beta-N-acetylglucosaminyltransferase [Candidatus Komeilibacteria bacterium]